LTIPAQKPLVYLITDGTATDRTYTTDRGRIIALIRSAIGAQVPLIQLREKHLCARLLFELAADAASLTTDTETRILINDRADIALASGADGVHLSTRSLPLKGIRRHLHLNFLIGVSTHTFEEVRQAARDGASFAVFGPVFATPLKGAPVGLKTLNEVVQKIRPFPILGLGGIDAVNWRSVLEAGAAGFAAIRSLNDAGSMHEIMRAVHDEPGK
jgi:thiamine-phosphate pyrophosphorylase